MPEITHLSALEILDSRGNPTVQATCVLASGAQGTVSVPSGASTGKAEALELRDGDPGRYHGLGCRQAVENVRTTLHHALHHREFERQRDLDRALNTLDGTSNKSNLGANALLAVSLAFARASAAERGIPLYLYFAELINRPVATLPLPMINLFSGGKHAGSQVAVQDVQVMPVSARTVDEALAMTHAVFRAAADLTYREMGMRVLTADEGGLAPPFPSSEAMIEMAVRAIGAAQLTPGRDVVLTVDVAASHFYREGRYQLENDILDGKAMVARLDEWLDRYPVVSLEDGLAEEDWDHWAMLCNEVGQRRMIMGDDLLCTNPGRIQKAIALKAANALLLKVNQIGTLTEAAEACLLAKSAGWQVTVSARSGETEDHWLADLAVGWSGDYIKVGSITQSERLAKYNRLLAIEAATALPLANRSVS
jgi:enolase